MLNIKAYVYPIVVVLLPLSNILPISFAQQASPSPINIDDGTCKPFIKCGENQFLTKEEIRVLNPKLSEKKINYLYNLQFKFVNSFKKEFVSDRKFFDIPKSICTEFEWSVNSANGFLVKNSINITKGSGDEIFDKYVVHIVELCEPFDGLVDELTGGKYVETKIRFHFEYLICKKRI